MPPGDRRPGALLTPRAFPCVGDEQARRGAHDELPSVEVVSAA